MAGMAGINTGVNASVVLVLMEGRALRHGDVLIELLASGHYILTLHY